MPRRAASGLPALADDCGIEVDALGGAPGVHTADWAETPRRPRLRAGDDADLGRRSRRRGRPSRGPRASAARWCWPGRTVTTRSSRARSRAAASGRCAATRGTATTRCSSPTVTRVTFGRWTAAEKNRISHRARRLRAAGGGLLWLRRALRRTGGPAASASTSTGRSARPNAPTATSTATCARGVDQAAGAARWSPRSRPRRREVPGRVGRHGLLRRRHPEPDAAGDRRGGDRGDRAAAGRWRRTPRSRSRPTRPRSRPGGSAAIATPGSTGCRWACRRSTTPTCARSGGCTTSPRRCAAFEVARAIFPRVSFDLIYARQGQTLAAWRARARPGAGDGGRPPVALPADDRGRHPLRRPRRARPAARPAGRRGWRPTCTWRRRRSARAAGLRGLRDLEPRPARRREPAQPRLLALRRLCRHRARARTAG